MTGPARLPERPVVAPPRLNWLTPRNPSQEYCTPSGVWWRVYEVAERRSGSITEPRSLVFESLTAMRRVCGFPGNWASLDSVALELLSRQR